MMMGSLTLVHTLTLTGSLTLDRLVTSPVTLGHFGEVWKILIQS